MSRRIAPLFVALSALALTVSAGCGGPEDGAVLEPGEDPFAELPPEQREEALMDSSAAARLQSEGE